MTTQQIQCIITLAEEGSFSKAAKKLFVTQPSISQLIKNMEMQLGAPLFDRSSSPIQLTPIGLRCSQKNLIDGARIRKPYFRY